MFIYIQNVIVRSHLTYSCQNWNINQHQQEQIRPTCTSLLRRMVRGVFERKVDGNDDETYQLVLSNKKI